MEQNKPQQKETLEMHNGGSRMPLYSRHLSRAKRPFDYQPFRMAMRLDKFRDTLICDINDTNIGRKRKGIFIPFDVNGIETRADNGEIKCVQMVLVCEPVRWKKENPKYYSHFAHPFIHSKRKDLLLRNGLIFNQGDYNSRIVGTCFPLALRSPKEIRQGISVEDAYFK